MAVNKQLIKKRNHEQLTTYCLRCVYTLRLIGPISYLGACYIRTMVINRLIAVCKRTFT